MNEEIKAKLEKYMQKSGYYDLPAIANDEHPANEDDPLGLNATLLAYFSADENGNKYAESELMAAARQYNENKIKLEKYMMPTGYYNTRKLMTDAGLPDTDAFFFDTFAAPDDIPNLQGEAFDLWRAAEDFNREKMSEEDRIEQGRVATILEKSDDEITTQEWELLVKADKAIKHMHASPYADMGQWSYSYNRKDPQPGPLFTDETEEELADMGL